MDSVIAPNMIRLLIGHNLKAAVPLAAVVLAQATTSVVDEAGVGAAILLTMIGMVLHWRAPRLRMSLEEHMKDGKVTDKEAQRRIRFFHWCESVATVAGIVVLLAVMFDLTR